MAKTVSVNIQSLACSKNQETAVTQYKDELVYHPAETKSSQKKHTTVSSSGKNLNRQSNMQRAARSFFSTPIQMKEADPEKKEDLRTSLTTAPKSAAIVNHLPHRYWSQGSTYNASEKLYRDKLTSYMNGNVSEKANLLAAENKYSAARKNHTRLSSLSERNLGAKFKDNVLRNKVDVLPKNKGIRGLAGKTSNASNKLAGPLGVAGGVWNICDGVSRLKRDEKEQKAGEKIDAIMQVGEGALGTVAGGINTLGLLPTTEALSKSLTVGTSVGGSGLLAGIGGVAGAGATGLMVGRRGDTFAREHLGDVLGKDRAGKRRGWSDMAADWGSSTYEDAIKGGNSEAVAHTKGAAATLGGSVVGGVGAGITGVAGIVGDVGNMFVDSADCMMKDTDLLGENALGRKRTLSDVPSDAGTAIKHVLVEHGVHDSVAHVAGGVTTAVTTLPTAFGAGVVGTAGLLHKAYKSISGSDSDDSE